jgi:hypothetical protein
MAAGKTPARLPFASSTTSDSSWKREAEQSR